MTEKPTCIDSHLHFDSFVKDGTQMELVSAAQEAGVERLIAIGGSVEANITAIEMHRQFPGVVHAVVGFDRDEAGKPYDVDVLRQQLALPAVVGVGETGIDYHYSADSAEVQKKLFAEMLSLAADFSKPVVIHSREADEDTLTLLTAYASDWTMSDRSPGVLHCFTGGQDFAEKLCTLDFMISFSGILSFKSATEIQEVAQKLPLDRILIETDAPYLAPVPYRGKRNQPAYVVEVARCLAELRNESVEKIMEVTAENTRRLFGI